MSRRAYSDAVGAFADGAVLFPLLAALSLQRGFSGAALLASAGLAYLASGWLFRVPLSVQPLKSIAIAAVSLGASALEVRIAGAFLGAFCLALLVLDVEAIARRVPLALIHGIQLSLGVLLILQGLKAAGDGNPRLLAALLLTLGFFEWLKGRFTGFPLLGWVATLGLGWAVFAGWGKPVPAVRMAAEGERLRPGLIAALVLPQLALTLANSVLGTRNVVERYFGAAGGRVTVRRLLLSIGAGNLVAAAMGGMPFCHGSGGVTAHYRGGARHWRMSWFIGGGLLVLGAIHFARGGLALAYPPELMGTLLLMTGVFHLSLARESLALGGRSRWGLLAMAGAVLATRNLLWALAVGVLFELGAGTWAGLRLRRLAG
ncbi:MAG: hypothetical protein NDJ89_17875 [Oligoflexia bacterium]|nr:hypothetical protein [Oligoflexia bacterium]